MNKSMLTGTVLGVFAATAVGSIASYKMLSGPEYAEVLSVTAVTESVKTPRAECRAVVVTQQSAVKDEHNTAGSGLGDVACGPAGAAIAGAPIRPSGCRTRRVATHHAPATPPAPPSQLKSCRPR